MTPEAWQREYERLSRDVMIQELPDDASYEQRIEFAALLAYAVAHGGSLNSFEGEFFRNTVEMYHAKWKAQV